jgi:hypothetical protein
MIPGLIVGLVIGFLLGWTARVRVAEWNQDTEESYVGQVVRHDCGDPRCVNPLHLTVEHYSGAQPIAMVTDVMEDERGISFTLKPVPRMESNPKLTERRWKF